MVLKLIRQLFLIFFSLGFLITPIAAASQININEFIESMDIKGDLRVRYDYLDLDKDRDNDPKDRMRVRFRLGFAWHNPDENWKIAAGLASGDEAGNTTNATYSEDEIFESGDVRLDYAYAQHTHEHLTFIAGQHKNIFYSSMALWDPDVRPAGLAARLDLTPVFVNAGYFQVRYADEDIAEMNALQVGINFDNVLGAIAIYDVHDAGEVLSEVEGLDSGYDYRIADFYTGCHFKLDAIEISPHAQLFYNFGAEGEPGEGALGEDLDPEDENLGWLVGVKAKMDRFSLGVEYTEIEADACIQDIKDSDFGSGMKSTDVKGFKIGLGYKVTKHCQFKTTGFFYEPIERDRDQNVDRYQIDLKYKF